MSSVRLIEVEPGIWRVDRRLNRRLNRRSNTRPPISDLPRPYVISDTMPPTEQVDGKFYTSKRAFRAVGRALGLTEVGNEKIPHKVRTVNAPETKQGRREAIKVAIEKYRAGLGRR